MPVTLQELLQPQLILDLVSRVRPGVGALGSWLGFQPTSYSPDTVSLSGPATVSGQLRYTSYRIFNEVRTPLKARAPGTGPGTVAQNPMGQVQVTCARFHSKIPLNYEFLGNLSPMVGPNSQIDSQGQSYIKQQSNYLAQQAGTMVEMMAAAMMRDSLYLQMSGDDWLPVFSAPSASGGITPAYLQVNFQIPSGNKSQLDMLGSGNIIGTTWANPAAPILTDIMKIKAAFAQLTRYPLTDIWINSTMWPNVINNTQVRNTGGSSNTPFAEYTNVPERGMDGQPTGKYEAILRGDPTITWHMNDDVVSLGSDIDLSYSTYSTGTANKLVPDNMAIFCTKPTPDIAKMYLGGEIVVENPGMPGVIRSGYYSWSEYVTQPSAIDLIALLNAVPCLYNPLCFAPATVVF